MPPRPTSTPAEPDQFAAFRARNKLIDQVRAALTGTGLDVRDRTNALVISNPGHPDNGRIYITYTTAEVSLSRPVWRYLGRLQGHGPTSDPEAEPTVDTAAIIAALTTSADKSTSTGRPSTDTAGPAPTSQQASPEPATAPEGTQP